MSSPKLATFGPFPVLAGGAGRGWIPVARMRAEERLLRTRFGGEYDAYLARTWRLIPKVY